MTTRIEKRFAALKAEGRAAFVTFLMAGDPDNDTSLAIVKALPAAGADVIELGMPFTDPMADGPSIQAAGLRALNAGQTLRKTLQLVRDFRKADDATPIILMGYFNPIYVYGIDPFLADAKAAGVDGLIVVDLPPEEDEELCLPTLKAGLNFIRLATPTTDDNRLPAVLANTSGFVYYVSITGITGAAAANAVNVTAAVARIKRHTKLPVAVGFGVRTAENARMIAEGADGVVVGTALVDALKNSLDAEWQGDAAHRRGRRRSRCGACGRRARREAAGRGVRADGWPHASACGISISGIREKSRQRNRRLVDRRLRTGSRFTKIKRHRAGLSSGAGGTTHGRLGAQYSFHIAVGHSLGTRAGAAGCLSGAADPTCRVLCGLSGRGRPASCRTHQ